MNTEARRGGQGLIIQDLVFSITCGRDPDLNKVVGGGDAEYRQCIQEYEQAQEAAGPGGWAALPPDQFCFSQWWL